MLMPSTDALAPNLFYHPSPIYFICLDITEPVEDLLGSRLDIAQDIVRPHVPRGCQGSCTGDYISGICTSLCNHVSFLGGG